MQSKLRIGMLAGEASGDILGAALLHALKQKYESIEAVGIAGPLMQAEGCHSLFDMECLSVMGLLEPLKRLPQLLSIRKSMAAYFLDNPPDIFIGIDSPDFNLHLEYLLKKEKIPTIHMVSPSVWAWRRGRIKKIRKSVDLMLTLFPFEADFYEQEGIPVKFVGHPLADEYSETADMEAARRELNFTDNNNTIIGLLPGSRGGEVKMLAPIFLQAARECWKLDPSLHFIIPAANDARYSQLARIIEDFPDLPLDLYRGQSEQIMAASDALLMASGTATLEALLLKKPMVVAYKMGALSYAVISRMLTTNYIALPNLLADCELVPEFVQSDVTAEVLAVAVIQQLSNRGRREELGEEFLRIHRQLRCGSAERAAVAISALISKA